MENAAAAGSNAAVSAGREASVRMQKMPLSFLKNGESSKVSKVRGKDEVRHHLENLGFVEGAEVRVVSEMAGSLIVEIKGTQVALDRSVASKIVVG